MQTIAHGFVLIRFTNQMPSVSYAPQHSAMLDFIEQAAAHQQTAYVSLAQVFQITHTSWQQDFHTALIIAVGFVVKDFT